MCCDANEALLPQTAPLIVLFDLPLIQLIRSPTFKVKRFASTSKCALTHVRVCACVHICTRKDNEMVEREAIVIVFFFSICPFLNLARVKLG